MKFSRIGFNEFIVWDFDVVDTEKLKEHENWADLHLTMPIVLRAHFASFNVDKNDKIHMCCDCDEREDVGVPCRCFFIHAHGGEVDRNDAMELGMFYVRWLKICNSYYGCEEDSEGEVADLFYARQSEWFQLERLGTRVTE